MRKKQTACQFKSLISGTYFTQLSTPLYISFFIYPSLYILLYLSFFSQLSSSIFLHLSRSSSLFFYSPPSFPFPWLCSSFPPLSCSSIRPSIPLLSNFFYPLLISSLISFHLLISPLLLSLHISPPPLLYPSLASRPLSPFYSLSS